MAITGFFISSSPNHIVRGILTSLMGCFLLFMPGLTMQTVMIMIGVMFLLSGLITMILSNRKRNRGMRGFWSFQGISNLAFGFAFVVAPNTMLKVFVFLLGCILLILGIIQLVGAAGTLSFSRWSWIFLIMAFLTLAGGILLLVNPFKSVETILSFIGALFIIYGISEIFMARKVTQKPGYFKGVPIQDIPHEEV
jgi:uncharacterized membrane protein HdeD (DUF308 family)